MHLSQLQIFSKKRDAVAALKGYEYQFLKTLETWLRNRLSNKKESVYCEYEEDILQRDLAVGEVKLRQIKLYSTDFSFSSAAIQETFANFFMLYVKGEYAFDTITFSFETNSGIVGREVRGNDADLLRELAGGWEKMSDERKGKARDRVRTILGDYVAKEVADRIGDTDIKPALQKAQLQVQNLPDDMLDHFIGSIQWRFDGLESNEAVDGLRQEIMGLVEELPLPGARPPETAFSVLYREVVARSVKDDPEQRRLESGDIDLVLLGSGDERARWYAEVYQRWVNVETIPAFVSGQFYEVVDASRYSRMEMYEARHNELWQRLFGLYYLLPSALDRHKRKAVYEYCFYSLHPDPLAGKELGSLGGQENKITYYFADRPLDRSADEMQQDISLFKLVISQVAMGRVAIEEEVAAAWGERILLSLNETLSKDLRVDERCRWLELLADYQMSETLTPVEDIPIALATFREILPLLSGTTFYSITDVVETLTEYAKNMVRAGQDATLVQQIEDFLDEARAASDTARSRHDAAHGFVERGLESLKAGDAKGFLQGLNYFHRARSLWALDRTWEGHILSLINLSQVYSSLGMNIAAKYYALSTIWATWHSKDESLYVRLVHGSALLFVADFRGGSWITAIDDYEMYMKARADFAPVGWADSGDDLFTNILNDISFLIAATKRLLPELAVFIDFRTAQWRELWTDIVSQLVQNMDKLLDEGRDVTKIARQHLSAEALNDVGPVRIIAFNALEIDWVVDFDNTFLMNAIGEEFVCVLQVWLCEIARVKPDLLKKGITVNIHVVQSPDYDRIKKREGFDDWLAPIPEFRGKEQQEIGYHSAWVSMMVKEVFLEYSVVTKDEFEAFMKKMLEKELVGERVSGVNPYQKVYYNVVDEKTFDAARRTAFTPLPPHTVFQEPIRHLIEVKEK